jgi:hypothetical protein
MQISKLMRGVLGAAVLAICGTAHAAYTVTISQVGPDVVASGSGSINTLDLLPLGAVTAEPLVHGVDALLYIGGTPHIFTAVDAPVPGLVVGPTSFGTSLFIESDAASGGAVGVAGVQQRLFVPPGYISGDPLSSSATWNGKTIASLGLTPGTYTWNWGAGANADSFTVVINAAPPAASIPTLSEWGLIGISGLVALFGLARVRRRG